MHFPSHRGLNHDLNWGHALILLPQNVSFNASPICYKYSLCKYRAPGLIRIQIVWFGISTELPEFLDVVWCSELNFWEKIAKSELLNLTYCDTFIWSWHCILYNYFNSTFLSVLMYCLIPSPITIPAEVSQNVTNKSCLVWEKIASKSPSDTWGPRGKGKPRSYFTLLGKLKPS